MYFSFSQDVSYKQVDGNNIKSYAISLHKIYLSHPMMYIFYTLHVFADLIVSSGPEV